VYCGQLQGFGNYYEILTELCYYNYFRVFPALDAELVEYEVQTVNPSYLWDRLPLATNLNELTPVDGGYGFGTMMVVLQSSQQETSFVFALPERVIFDAANGQKQYALFLQKQAGIGVEQVHIVVTLPAGSTLVRSSIPPTTVEDNTLTWDLSPLRDVELNVFFTP
jgi:hypothetical protein